MRFPTGRLLALVGAAALLSAAAGCGPAAITRTNLQGDFGPTFANMYVLQQRLLGNPSVTADAQLRTATCARGGPETPDRGPGNDWSCQVYWPLAPAGQAQTVSYDVEAKPTGCYTAQGPANEVGQQTIRAADGRMVTNPLFEFYGCLDLG
jgi:hypothetical protein